MTFVELSVPKLCSSPLNMSVLDIEVLPLKTGEQPTLPAAISFVANDEPPLHRSKKTFVARGILNTSDGAQLDTACKIVWGRKAHERLKHEAEFYMNELYNFQGFDVPRFYGIFSGTEGEKTVSCIFLEYCGVNPTESSLLPNREMWYVLPILWSTAQLTSP